MLEPLTRLTTFKICNCTKREHRLH